MQENTNENREERPEGSQSREGKEATSTIWQELDTWAESFRPWQKFILSCAIRTGRVSDDQVQDAYQLFLSDFQLTDLPAPATEIPSKITGRPTTRTPAPVRIVSIKNFHSINALPTNIEITFSNGLTIIYGGNGAGKTGIVRALSNICFSRMQHSILPNIYQEDSSHIPASVEIVINADSENQHIAFTFDDSSAYTDLKRITIFDSSVARTHLTEQSPIGFKPAGFDIFPELARVYTLLSSKLASDIQSKIRDNFFIKSFVGNQSPISSLVGALNADTDIEALRNLAVFGETEHARLSEIQRQIRELRSHSVDRTIHQLEEAGREITKLKERLNEACIPFSEESRVVYRSQLIDFTAKAKAVANYGAESFQLDNFKAIGIQEWEAFLTAAKVLAKLESPEYPQEQDHCLLCHRPLDEASINMIHRFWGFLESDAKRQMEIASSALDESVRRLKETSLEIFSDNTIVKAHVVRLNPELAKQISELLLLLEDDRNSITGMLRNASGEISLANYPNLLPAIISLIKQNESDIIRLRAQSVEEALTALEFEENTLRHRKILNQLISDIEIYINDLAWIRKASDLPKRSLNPRHLTEKETQLFSTLIAEQYKERLVQECAALNCQLPVEFRTKGDRGQTLKSLRMPGGHSPQEILSEGEQRAIALADFLTEISLNPASTGIVLDDPVTSQDNDRRKKIAERLVIEAKNRQVIIFTHDLVFLTMLRYAAEQTGVEKITHWIERDSSGNPGQVSLDDCPDVTPQFRSTKKAVNTLAEAKVASGSRRLELVRRGMGELRRTIEEVVPHHLFKQVLNRWSDRVIVTGLKKINWDYTLISEIETIYEELSAQIEGHTHTEERQGNPPEPNDLQEMITRIDTLITQLKSDRRPS